ncbi:MAG: GNAT family N-acetyltransferase [Solirubrobacteraceae bacterium]
MELAPDYPVVTARLLLWRLSEADIDALVAYRSLEDVCRFVPFEPMSAEVVTAKLTEGWSRRTIAAEGDALTLGVELVQARQLIGDVVLFFRSAEHRSGEVGWVFHPGFSGCGYATEAAHALLHLACDGLSLHSVIARIDARNEASLRLGARLGMRQEAHLISNEWFKGDWSDEIDLALLEHEWVAQHADRPRWCDSPWAPSSMAAM